jgi:translation initiation factor eIF-2B subunit gamma
MEFHAVICCGKGVNLSPFSSTRESGIAKALLPIGNKPMIEYVLEWCDQAPFRAISVVCDPESHEEIAQLLEQYKQNRPKEAQACPLNIIDFEGESTGEILEQFINQLESAGDFVLLPCDFITDLPPQVLIEEYRNREEEDIAMSVHYLNQFENIDKKNLTHYYTVYSQDQHLLDIYSKDSVEASKFLELRTQMVWRYPNSTVSTKLLDSFIYFFSQSALSVLKKYITDYKSKSITKIIRDLARRSWRHSEQQGTISLFVLPNQCTFVRSDNIPAYIESNRYIMKLKAREQQQPPQAKEKGAATIGADSVVGENTQLGERTSVKKTVVGKNCNIGKRCRLTGCVLLDNITLADDVVLENCVIGQGAAIHDKARLTNCNIEGGYTVNKGFQAKGETLTNLFIEGQESESDSEDEGSDDYDSYEDDYSDDMEDDGLFER